MEIHFKNVSISADIVAKDEKNTAVELPTLKNKMMKGVRGLVTSKHTANKQILKGVNGVFKPCTITLVLGQPSSGKSLLMKLLSDRFPEEENIVIEGDVMCNGAPAADLRKVTGLDSVSTFAIIATQRSIAKKFCKTIVISLLQPSPEVFALFDNVMFLNDGHIMYHGPREKTLGHFESLGFWHPLRRDGADLLLDLRTDEQYQYEVDIAPGDTVPRSPCEFAKAFE
ncbi:hypothetical protein BBO99_00009703 [Phytophthora kernoviae]|uniref:Uncharacterized protein n=2 Tax=Phytophthora kernoviae TaxID=325452 RepID=A0A3R7MNH7_9STRA|nr:hypothetical protein G195_011505 [Phytophthora kernoviae 00238/432]KAG2502703.1 hypothetical protein JM16_009669 [Phytophthora kernoviae]KAG2503079.1 hypothetical protein JM18_009643 [Phytophthora kernoviae]RLN14332.1 hypothetical protein BBI17_009748 [Phytophthora kernoviae]RLN72718.1 hypothetical protein BBO99_00009703 [Phytophthora kernoviae]